MPPQITPRTLKGFRDYLPEAMIPRERIIETARRVYRSYGFRPIDTPALEYLDILVGKGGTETDKQLYRFSDAGGREVGMRFDLTVPLARFAAQHITELGTPFKRYHIATVWRGENTQRGRYREFMQCDFDTVGTTGVASDAESVLVIHDLLRAIGFEQFTIRINHRQILTGLIEKLGLETHTTEVLRALDKLAKIGPVKVATEIEQSTGASARQVNQLLAPANIVGSNEEVITELQSLVQGSQPGELALARLAETLKAVAAGGIAQERVRVDSSIARGLDYYTGIVYETLLDAPSAIGSVASGGRYDNLAEVFTKQQLPGVGGSLGLDRLLTAMQELGMVETVLTTAPVFIPYFAADRLPDYLRLAANIRGAGIGVEVYPDAKKLGKQLQYADRRGFRVALILGDDEFTTGECQVKDLATGGSQTVRLDEGNTSIVAEIKQLLEA